MHAAFSPHFLLDCLSIILIDLLLAGDNALVIAIVVRGLPAQQRRLAILFGAALAVVLRVAITFSAAQLWQLPFARLIGGVLIVWIAVKVLVDAKSETAETAPPTRLLQAIGWIVAADLTMSLDNILAVAGASHGSLLLILFGLGLSIPFVIFSSGLLSVLMDRFPILIYLGAGILGKVAGEMILTDPAVVTRIRTTEPERYLAEAALSIGIILVGRTVSRRFARHADTAV